MQSSVAFERSTPAAQRFFGQDAGKGLCVVRDGLWPSGSAAIGTLRGRAHTISGVRFSEISDIHAADLFLRRSGRQSQQSSNRARCGSALVQHLQKPLTSGA